MASSSPTENRRIFGVLKRIVGNIGNAFIPLTKPESTIGRDRKSDIWFDDVSISRTHCTLQHSSTGWTITDGGGINGTYVSGKKLTSRTPAPLEDRAVIFLGRPDKTTYGFLFMKTTDDEQCDSSAVTRPSSSTVETDMQTFKRGVDAETSSGVANKRFKRYAPLPSLISNEMPNHPRESRAFLASTTRSNEPIPGPSFSDVRSGVPQGNEHSSSRVNESASAGNSRLRILFSPDSSDSEGNQSVRAESEVIARFRSTTSPSDNEPIAGPSLNDEQDSSDGGNATDCSHCSLDSLKTRIRKNRVREIRNISRSLRSEAGSAADTSSVKLDDCSPVRTPKQVAVTKNKKKISLWFEKLAESVCASQQDTDNENSESLLPDDCAGGAHQPSTPELHVEKPNNIFSESAKTSEQDSTIEYLKERVLKLQENLIEAQSKLKIVNSENKKQEQLIEMLKSKEGISYEQLTKVLEDELCCNICTEIFIKPTTLNCAHTFCEHCISVWKKKKKQCPMCRERITSETGIKVLDNLINKVVEHLDEAYRTRRSELIQSRIEEKGKVNKKRKKTRVSAAQRERLRTANQARLLDPRNSQQLPLWSPADGLHLDFLGLLSNGSALELQLDDGSDTSVEGSGYYGGFGRCYQCGRRGHWANGCPD